jgi:hypothetical protein
MKLIFVDLWHLWFWRRGFFKEFAVFTGFWPKYDLEMMIKDKSQT